MYIVFESPGQSLESKLGEEEKKRTRLLGVKSKSVHLLMLLIPPAALGGTSAAKEGFRCDSVNIFAKLS